MLNKKLDGTLVNDSSEAITSLIEFNKFWIENFYFFDGDNSVNLAYSTGRNFPSFLSFKKKIIINKKILFFKD